MSLDAVVAATSQPATRTSLVRDLRAMGLHAGDLVLVHSSLSALGFVVGGAATVIEALLAVLGPNGTLVMPAHCPDGGDPAHWRAPPVPSEWVDILRAHRPPYDPARTPTRGMGAIPELFRTWPGVVRSEHPIGSFAAHGPLASAVTRDHALGEMLGERSPLGELYRRDGRILLLGVGHGANTSLHLGESRADWPDKAFIIEGSRILRDGQSEWVSYEMLCWDDDDFPALGAAYEAGGSHTVGSVGDAEARLFRQRDLVDFATAWLSETRGT